MPAHCSAYRCSSRRSLESRLDGITFHRFPKEDDLRKKWEIALRKVNFVATDVHLLCSKHFKPQDFDRTGQTVRIRLGAIPSIFDFPAHLIKQEIPRTTETSRRAEESLPVPVDLSQDVIKIQKPQCDDHTYALPICPSALMAKFVETRDRLAKLQREKNNAVAREKRTRHHMKNLLKALKESNSINKELNQRLGLYSEHSLHLSEKDLDLNEDTQEEIITLHLHGPKAYKHLRDSLRLPLPDLPCDVKTEATSRAISDSSSGSPFQDGVL